MRLLAGATSLPVENDPWLGAIPFVGLLNVWLAGDQWCRLFVCLGASCGSYLAAKNDPIWLLRNLASAGLLAALAVCPHNDGIGSNVTCGMNCAS